MSRLQGIRIPLCYGYFVVGPMECLVLDYCGEPLSVPFADLEWKIKGEVMQGFWSIHHSGVQHKDPSERNVLQDSTNKIFIIDFEHSSTSHDCKGACPKVSAIAPEAPDYGCAELWNVFTELGIWMPCASFFCVFLSRVLFGLGVSHGGC
ncbi:uncharacterized protein STEHIDRAFT_96493 [Stereum hirsutum FP-91666 SS1]|uniref:uncharacterized protein n=1 Tax=Stereum hirsutum (strain FP-91666) TaxID=721885 RepID=UPI000440A5D1|nr:uncharacterized protein STEHIDRAFT_96493 [Stereum hirsutum FP-91666 SS1]EIM87413.1 hypothetical protein STEHIDRAFT_96493 [Stereum hirsutum FP-91666 SS1]